MLSKVNHDRQTRTDLFYWRAVVILMACNFAIGVGFIVGAPVSAQFIIAANIAPLWVWGAIAALSAITCWYGMYAGNRTAIMGGLFGAGFGNIFIALTFLMTIATGHFNSFTGIFVWVAIGSLHFLAALGLPNSATIIRLREHV